MKSDRQSRVWPYLGLLACLFALSVTAPTSWREAALRRADDAPTTSELAQKNYSLSAKQSRDSRELYQDQTMPEFSAQSDAEESSFAAPVAEPVASVVSHAESETITDTAVAGVQVSDPHDRLAMRFPASDELAVEELEPAEPATSDAVEAALTEEAAPTGYEDSTSGESLSGSETIDAELDLANTPEQTETLDLGYPPEEEVEIVEAEVPEPTQTELSLPYQPAAENASPALAAPADPDAQTEIVVQETPAAETVLSQEEAGTEDLHGWTMPTELLEQLKTIEAFPVSEPWVADTRLLLDQLCGPQLPDAETRAELLAELNKGLKILKQMAAQEKEWAVKAKLLRVQYSLSRRLHIWMAIDALGAPPMTVVTDDPDASPRLARRISEFSALAKGKRQGEAWRRHLKIDDLQQTMDQAEDEEHHRRRLAHLVLGRMDDARNNPQQKEFVESAPLANLDSALRDWSAESVDLCRLLENLETYESNRSPDVARQLAEKRQSLIWSPNESDHLLGKEIEHHYRNANVRLAISDDLMNRFLPKPQILEDAVDDTIVGAAVSGYSRTLNRLQLRLIPDPHKIRMGLEAHGVVHSNTGSSSGPVTIYNRGEASYVARKLFLVSDTGLHIWPAVSEASAFSNTHGMDTDYDAIPVLRTFVRKIAETQQDELYGEAMAEVEARVRETSRRRLDQEADPRISKMGQIYEQKVHRPLEQLDLKPTPISMSTTEDRAIIRFRVAGDNQLGAHTPRPCAPSDSVASMQVHESVLNNVADQLNLNGNTFTLPELHRMVAEKLGLEIAEPADLPVDAHVTFADKDAVVIRCDDGKIWVTLSVAELKQGRSSFHNFKATAVYHLISHGLHTELERDGVVQLQGERLNFREQIALRGVTAKLFSQNRKPQVISAERAKDPKLSGLSVSQLVVLDGWIGLAIAPSRVVRTPSDTNTSTNR